MTKTNAKTAARKSAPKAARRPKVGSARTNQTEATSYAEGALPKGKKSAALAKAVNADRIVTIKNTEDGKYILVQAANGDHFTRLRANGGDSKEFRTAVTMGGSYSAAARWDRTNPPSKPIAKLARGAEGKMTENSRKAVADQRAAPAKGKAPAKAENKGKARVAKAEKAKQPSKGNVRKYKKGERKDESKPDTFRRYMLTTILAHKDTASAKAAHAASGQYPTHKLDFNWSAQQGYIVFAD